MRTVKRNALFVLVYFVGVAIYLWFDPIVSENVSDWAGLLIPVIGLAGLIWANVKSFPNLRRPTARLAARIAVAAFLATLLLLATNIYSWHVRPALGLHCGTKIVADMGVDGAR
jgi:hypothetical protein